MKHEARKRFYCIFGIDFFWRSIISITYQFFSFFSLIREKKIFKMCFNTTILSENGALLQANKTIMTRNRNRLQQRKFKGPRYTPISLYFVCLLFNPFSERIQWGAYRLLIKIQSITSSFSWCIHQKQPHKQKLKKNLFKMMTCALNGIELSSTPHTVYSTVGYTYIYDFIEQTSNITVFYSFSTLLIKIISIWNC